MEDSKFQIEKKHDSVTKTIRITVSLEKILEELAAKNNLSFNALVIQCIEFSLKRLAE